MSNTRNRTPSLDMGRALYLYFLGLSTKGIAKALSFLYMAKRSHVAIEPKNREILALTMSKERNMFVAERFAAGLVRTHGKHAVSTGGGTWHPQACRFLKVGHHLHPPFEKSVIERTMQYLKDRTEGFDYFPCKKKKCKLKHVMNWLHLFVDYHNRELDILK